MKKLIAGLAFGLTFCLEAEAQTGARDVISFAVPAIDCYSSAQSLNVQRCEMADFDLPQAASAASDNFRLRLRDRSGRRWWVREGDVVFEGAAGQLSVPGPAPRQGRGVRAAFDDDRVRSVILAGAAAPPDRGAAIALIDAQEQALRAQLRGTGVGVHRVSATELLLNVPADLVFSPESAEFAQMSPILLARLGEALGQQQVSLIDIRGYSDASGSPAHSQTISERRAERLASALINVGVRRERVVTAGYGEASPIASNLTDLGRARNRRVEISIRAFAAGRE